MNTNNVIKLKRKRIKKINPLWIIAGLLAAILIAVLVILVRGGAEGIAETGSVTVLVLLLFISSRARGRSTVTVFRRTIPNAQLMNAMTISLIMIVLAIFGGIFISATSPVGFTDALFEAVSALGTVGLTAGATSLLSVPSQILIIIFMYFGRVGGLTMIYAFTAGSGTSALHFPQEPVTVG